MPARPDPREPLNRMLRAIQISDADMRVLLRDSAREAQKIIAAAGNGVGGRVRAAQIDLSMQQQQMWRDVGDLTRVAISDGVDAAADSATYLVEIMSNGAGVKTAYIRNALLAQAREGIQSYISRTSMGIPLSQQVYRTSVASGGQLDRLINAYVLNGASAKEIANAVYKFIDPLTPGGASYSAMRLGRTELNNAFHATTLRLHGENPFVEAMKWNLSRSHPKTDKCDEYANSVHKRGAEPGVYDVSDVPSKPHPQCFCYLSPVTVSDDDFVKAFQSGKYDNWIDNVLGGAA